MVAQNRGIDITRLHGLARAFDGAIVGSNELPEGFPREEMRLVARTLCELDGTDTLDDRQVLIHARAKLRETREIFRSITYDELAIFHSERMHNALFAEIDALLESIPPRELVALQPSAEEPALVIRRAEFEARVAALEHRVEVMRTAGREALTYVDQSRHIDVALLKISGVRLRLDSLVRVAGSLKAELAAHLIDLGWLSQLTGRIAALIESLGEGVNTLRRAIGELDTLTRAVEHVRRLGQHVINGGKALFRLIRRTLAGTASLPTLWEARDEAEAAAVRRALELNNYDIRSTARTLGIGRITLYRLMEKHAIQSVMLASKPGQSRKDIVGNRNDKSIPPSKGESGFPR